MRAPRPRAPALVLRPLARDPAVSVRSVLSQLLVAGTLPRALGQGGGRCLGVLLGLRRGVCPSKAESG